MCKAKANGVEDIQLSTRMSGRGKRTTGNRICRSSVIFPSFRTGNVSKCILKKIMPALMPPLEGKQ